MFQRRSEGDVLVTSRFHYNQYGTPQEFSFVSCISVYSCYAPHPYTSLCNDSDLGTCDRFYLHKTIRRIFLCICDRILVSCIIFHLLLSKAASPFFTVDYVSCALFYICSKLLHRVLSSVEIMFVFVVIK